MYKVFADYLSNKKPQSQFVKDVVRGTILIDTFVQLDKAYAVLTAKHPPVIVKNRLGEATRDVLVYVARSLSHGIALWTVSRACPGSAPPAASAPCY
jgi:hypothetical protein